MTYVPPEPHDRMLEDLRHRVKAAADAYSDAKLRFETLTAALTEMQRVCDQAIRAKEEHAKP